MLLEQLRAKRQAIEALGQKFGAKRIRVFGSVARGEENDRSDIDFLVEFPRGYDLFQQRIPLTEELSLLLGRPADVVPEHELSPHIRARVIVEAVEL
jgi:predicted nucleotidyltransferase